MIALAIRGVPHLCHVIGLRKSVLHFKLEAVVFGSWIGYRKPNCSLSHAGALCPPPPSLSVEFGFSHI